MVLNLARLPIIARVILGCIYQLPGASTTDPNQRFGAAVFIQINPIPGQRRWCSKIGRALMIGDLFRLLRSWSLVLGFS